MSEFVVNGPRSGSALGKRDLALHIGGIAALALVLVTSNAFGSDDLSLARRILMFGVVSALLVVQASAAADVARRYRRPSFVGAAGSIVLALGTILLLMTLEVHLLKATPIVPYDPDPLPEFALFLMPFVIPVGALVLSLKWSERRTLDARPMRLATHVAPSAPLDLSPAFDDRIAGWPREPVLRIRVVDHYLELWTRSGISLVRGRMQDAIRRVPHSMGIQPHRSWWVAFSEIDCIERHKRDLFLLLKSGDRLPVARARVADVKYALERQRDR